MPPIPGSIGIAGAAAAGSFLSATKDSVVNTMAAMEAAFCSAERVTLLGLQYRRKSCLVYVSFKASKP